MREGGGGGRRRRDVNSSSYKLDHCYHLTTRHQSDEAAEEMVLAMPGNYRKNCWRWLVMEMFREQPALPHTSFRGFLGLFKSLLDSCLCELNKPFLRLLAVYMKTAINTDNESGLTVCWGWRYLFRIIRTEALALSFYVWGRERERLDMLFYSSWPAGWYFISSLSLLVSWEVI